MEGKGLAPQEPMDLLGEEEEDVIVISDTEEVPDIIVVSDDDNVIFVPPERQLNILELPMEILWRVLQEVVALDGDVAFHRLSLTCSHFRDLVTQQNFRDEAHYAWLDSVVDWSTKPPEFRAKYRVPYVIQNCLSCHDLYKEMAPGYFGEGKRGELRGFYSSIDFSGYCSQDCYFFVGNLSPRD